MWAYLLNTNKLACTGCLIEVLVVVMVVVVIVGLIVDLIVDLIVVLIVGTFVLLLEEVFVVGGV